MLLGGEFGGSGVIRGVQTAFAESFGRKCAESAGTVVRALTKSDKSVNPLFMHLCKSVYICHSRTGGCVAMPALLLDQQPEERC